LARSRQFVLQIGGSAILNAISLSPGFGRRIPTNRRSRYSGRTRAAIRLKVSFSWKVSFSLKVRKGLTAAFLNPENSLGAFWLCSGIRKKR